MERRNAGGGGACRTHPHILHLTPCRLPRVNGAGRGAPLLLLLPRLPLLHHLHSPLNSLLKQSAGREELNLLHQKRGVQTPLLVPPRLPSLRTLLSPDLKPACLLCFAPLTFPDCSPTGPKPLPAAQATLIPSEASGPLGSVLGLSGNDRTISSRNCAVIGFRHQDADWLNRQQRDSRRTSSSLMKPAVCTS